MLRLTSDLGPLRVPAFRRYLLASTLAYVALWTYMTVLSWTVLEVSDSPAALGLLFMAMTIPLPLAVVPAGALADRIGPRNLMAVALVVEAVLILATSLLAATGQLTTPIVVAVGLIFGIADGFYLVPSQVYVARLVEPRLMGSAIGLAMLSVGIGRIAGGPLGGSFVTVAGAAIALVPAAGGLLVSFATLLRLPQPAGIGGGVRLTRADLVEGVRWTRQTIATRPIFLLGIIAAVVVWPYLGLIAVIARDLLEGDPGDLGLLTAAGGFGALVAAAVVGTIGRRAGFGRLLIAGVAAGAVSLVLLGVSRWPPASLFAAAVLGAALVAHTASSSMLLQSLADVGMRGRAMAIYGFVFYGLMPIGGAAAGAATEAWGITSVLVGMGLLTCVGTVLVAVVDLRTAALGHLMHRSAGAARTEVASGAAAEAANGAEPAGAASGVVASAPAPVAYAASEPELDAGPLPPTGTGSR